MKINLKMEHTIRTADNTGVLDEMICSQENQASTNCPLEKFHV